MKLWTAACYWEGFRRQENSLTDRARGINSASWVMVLSVGMMCLKGKHGSMCHSAWGDQAPQESWEERISDNNKRGRIQWAIGLGRIQWLWVKWEDDIKIVSCIYRFNLSSLSRDDSIFLSQDYIKAPTALHRASAEVSMSHLYRLLRNTFPGELIIAYIITSLQKRLYKHLPHFH